MRDTDERPNTAPGYRIAMVLLGIAITPVLLSSSSLGSQLSSLALIKVVVSCGIILTILSGITICVGEKARLPTYGIVKYPFGEKRAIAINVLLAISLFGWIAVTANMFGHSVHDLLAQQGLEIPVPVLVAIGCVIFVAATAFGFELLGKVAQFAIPVIAVMLCYSVYVAANGMVPVPAGFTDMNTGVAVSTVVGTIIVLVATLPDFGSFVHDRKHALIGAVLTFLIAYPLLYWAGATPSGISGKASLLGAMAVFGAVLPAALLLIFATVTGNAGNMFQGTLVVSTLFTRFPKWQITVALGVLAVIVGSMDIMAWFIPLPAVSGHRDAARGRDLYSRLSAVSARRVRRAAARDRSPGEGAYFRCVDHRVAGRVHDGEGRVFLHEHPFARFDYCRLCLLRHF
jgi:cytosine permease